MRLRGEGGGEMKAAVLFANEDIRYTEIKRTHPDFVIMENPKLRLHSTICWSLKSLETLR